MQTYNFTFEKVNSYSAGRMKERVRRAKSPSQIPRKPRDQSEPRSGLGRWVVSSLQGAVLNYRYGGTFILLLAGLLVFTGTRSIRPSAACSCARRRAIHDPTHTL